MMAYQGPPGKANQPRRDAMRPSYPQVACVRRAGAVVVITGAAGGIVAAAATQFVADGYIAASTNPRHHEWSVDVTCRTVPRCAQIGSVDDGGPGWQSPRWGWRRGVTAWSSWAVQR